MMVFPMHQARLERRRLGLDALRGLAVLLMVEQHVGIWMWRGPHFGERLSNFPFLITLNALGGGAAPLFVTLAGVGAALMAARGRAGLDARFVRRGWVLWSFGVILNFLSPSWFSWGSWYVLHLMGFAIALTPLWRRWSDQHLLLAVAVIFAVSVAVQEMLGTPLVLDNERMRDVTLPGGPLRLALAEGQFPVLPWLALFLAGFLAGRCLHRGEVRRVAWLGLGMLAFGAIGHGLFRWGWLPLPASLARRAFGLGLGFFPCSVAMGTLLLGGALLLIAGAFWLDNRRDLSPRHPLVTLGRSSLTLLMLHVPIFRDLSRLSWFGWWRALSAEQALAVVGGVLLIATALSWLWSRVDYRYGAEWALRKIAG